MNEDEKGQADEIRKRLLMCSSHERLELMLEYTEDVSDAVFWDVFAFDWTHCDATWLYQDALLYELATRSVPNYPASKIGTDESRKFFSSLPDPVTVYRGCSRERVLGDNRHRGSARLCARTSQHSHPRPCCG